jgi:hypothetical protein
MVVWWRRTQQRVVREAIRRLALHPDQPAGIILTKVDAKRAGQDIFGGYRS